MAPGAIRLSSEPDTRRWLAALVKTRSWSDLKRVTLRSLRVEGLPLRVRPVSQLLPSSPLTQCRHLSG